MNKKLLTLAVAAAIAAPTAAMAEAVLYGKLHVHVDYVDITNAVPADWVPVNGTPITELGSDTTYTTYPRYGVPEGVYPPGVTVSGPDPIFNAGTSDLVITDPQNPGVEITLAPGQSYSLLGTDVVGPAGDVVAGTAIPLYPIEGDGSGRAITVPGTGSDFKGWGVDSESWRKYTTVNPGTGIETTAQGPANRVGVKGSEDLGNGLKAIYQVELGINFASADNDIPGGNNGISVRNSFVGLASDYGTVLVGRHDTPLKISTGKLDLFTDTIADYNGTVGFNDIRADNVVAYISPSFSGFSFMGATVAGGGTNALGGSTTASGLNYENTSLASAYSLALIYNNGPFYGSAAYEVLSNEMFMSGDVSNAGSAGCLDANGGPTLGCDYVADDFSKWRLGLGLLDWNGFTLTAVYENQDDLPGGQTRDAIGYIDPQGNVTLGSAPGVKSQNLWQVSAGYSFGNNMFKAMYGSVNRDAGQALANFRGQTLAINNVSNLASGLRKDLEGDRSTWAVGFDHNFSKRTKAYVLYTAVDDQLDRSPLYSGAEWSGFSLGMIHKF